MYLSNLFVNTVPAVVTVLATFKLDEPESEVISLPQTLIQPLPV